MPYEQVHPQEDERHRRSAGPAVNKVILVGRLTGDPDVRQSAGGEQVTSMRLATNVGGHPEFHSLVAFGATARFAGEHLAKGRLVYAEGRLQTREWTGPDGDQQHTTQVVAHIVQALDRPAQRDDAEREQEEAER